MWGQNASLLVLCFASRDYYGRGIGVEWLLVGKAVGHKLIACGRSVMSLDGELGNEVREHQECFDHEIDKDDNYIEYLKQGKLECRNCFV